MDISPKAPASRWLSIAAIPAALVTIVMSFFTWIGFTEDIGVPWTFTGTGRIIVSGHPDSAMSKHYSGVVGDALGEPGVATAVLAAIGLLALLVGMVWRSVVPAVIAGASLVAATVVAAAVWISPSILMGDLGRQIGAESVFNKMIGAQAGLMAVCLSAGVAAALALAGLKSSVAPLILAALVLVAGCGIGALAIALTAA